MVYVADSQIRVAILLLLWSMLLASPLTSLYNLTCFFRDQKRTEAEGKHTKTCNDEKMNDLLITVAYDMFFLSEFYNSNGT